MRMNRKDTQLLVESWRRLLREGEALGVSVEDIFANSDESYVISTLENRKIGAPNAAGSVFDAQTTIEDIKGANWRRVEYPGLIREPAIAFETSDVGGYLGIVGLSRVSPDTVCKIQTGHNGKATTPNGDPAAECILRDVDLEKQEVTTLIAGPMKEDPERFIVWTFYPGTPEIPDVGGKDGPETISMVDVERIARESGWEEVEDGRRGCEGMIAFKTTVGELRSHYETKFSMGKYSASI